MGTYIKQLRKEMGISQEELGKPLNIPVNKITEKRKYPGTSSEEFWKGCCEGLGNVL
jgi:DNA-binding transcriptional regulator YiaG|nr:MAG TPA: regulatory protein [Caudoviricetes sp.]